MANISVADSSITTNQSSQLLLALKGEWRQIGYVIGILSIQALLPRKLASDVRVMINQYSLINPDPGEEEIPVFKITIKEDYKNDTKFNDIAILQVGNYQI